MKDQKLIAVVFGIAAILLSCNTAKKDFNNVNQAILRNPAQTSKQLAEKWPCIPLIQTKDSTDYKKYLEDLNNMTAFYEEELKHKEVEHITDTFSEVWADTSKIKWYKRELGRKQLNEKYLNSYIDSLSELCSNNPGIHDTIKVNDETLVKKLTELNDKNIVLQDKIDTGSVFKNWLMIILLILGLITGFFIGNKFKI